MGAHGTVPPSHEVGHRREASWYAGMAEEYARRWIGDPLGSGLEMFAADCTSGHVGRVESRGIKELAGDRRDLLEQLCASERFMHVHRVAGEGSAVAMLVAIGNATRVTRGTVVLTFDRSDRVVSERTYLDWSRAVPRSELGDRPIVGGPDWTLHSR